ncbi:pathogenesis-related protein PRB1-2-like [Canna indica]|uniref:Pathogenesis-related protein PRB1-2-like n=1 Tax=Canna indica TaxID=4628 RepID=A0AAQ3JYN5_9LILI|nr:pathogenesis-related protein PRB1-2-like [Canna indica]
MATLSPSPLLFFLLFLITIPISSQRHQIPAQTHTSVTNVDANTPTPTPAPAPATAPVSPQVNHTQNGTTSAVREFLSSHNQVRAILGESPIEWDRSLAKYARWWSRLRRADCAMVHSTGPYGENLFWGSGQNWTAADAVRIWAEERAFYDPVDNSCSPGKMCGHFTQIVWNDTVRFGCAVTKCHAGGGIFVVCDYDPPGNWVGERPFNLNS